MENFYIELMNKAKEASKNAYCPYSKFPVGACVMFESGNMFLGCNVENASYGLAICAERNAIQNAIVNGEKGNIKAIAIYSPKQTMCVPCGACRQWLNEFSVNAQETKIILENTNDKLHILSLSEIFPHSFKLMNN